MTKQKQYVSDVNVTVCGSSRPSSTHGEDDSVFELISVDLVTQILSRLPVKSMAQCRCVSKLWSSIIRRPNYNLLFPIKSPATPRFLFIARDGIYGPNLFISSSPQPENPDEHSSSLVATLHSRSATDYFKICPPVNGLVCREYTEKDHTFAVISNPLTGEYVRTPEVTTDGYPVKKKTYFGYDPFEEQFKVMIITWLPCVGLYEYKVLTLGEPQRTKIEKEASLKLSMLK
ncbi:probable F-box protein At1g53815 [Capsella rubella]|uniref:probable F-box protein At1g53815 n=1 Tax=Capsella rubella TaxID=81985 RepID=UPI000CD5311A|nr:probable F-box protein At1g53815 [Capsella rubella]